MDNSEPSQHLRHSLRLKGYDYSQAGSYFLTICSQNRISLFGNIIDSEMILNDAGKMILDVWNQIPDYYPYINIDEFVVMPNHVHGILVLEFHGQSQGIAPTVPRIVQRFKTLTTKKYIDGVNQKGWQYFQPRLRQRNYYEHIVRDEDDLNLIRNYIKTNPLKWSLDAENPDCS